LSEFLPSLTGRQGNLTLRFNSTPLFWDSFSSKPIDLHWIIV
jgi:hypothetical protein